MKVTPIIARTAGGAAATYIAYYLLLRVAGSPWINGLDPLPAALFIGLCVVVPVSNKLRLLAVPGILVLLVASYILRDAPVLVAGLFIAVWSSWLWRAIVERWRR